MSEPTAFWTVQVLIYTMWTDLLNRDLLYTHPVNLNFDCDNLNSTGCMEQFKFI